MERTGVRLLAGALAIVVVTLVLAAALAPRALAQDCSNDQVGVRPLDDQRTHDYLGQQGGLYSDGTNTCPARHDKAGRRRALSIVPLDATGEPSDTGTIGVAALGFSIARRTMEAFLDLADDDDAINPAITFVNAAEPSMYADLIADPTHVYWTDLVPANLAEAGLDARQIEVVWLMTGVLNDSDPFPDHARTNQGYYVAIVQNVLAIFPNVKLCYLSSLPYMGYTLVKVQEEPHYFEQGFSQKWLIEDQIAGDEELRWDAEDAPAVAPWLAWGPYLWSDGIVPRSDGLTWTCDDVSVDGGHPSEQGALKLAALLRHFWASDPTATPWFLASGAGQSGRAADVELVGDGTTSSTGESLISVNQYPTIPTATELLLQAWNVPRRGYGLFFLGFELLPGGGIPLAGGTFYVDSVWSLPVTFDRFGTGSYSLDLIPDDPALYGLDAYAQLVGFTSKGPNGPILLTSAIELRLGD